MESYQLPNSLKNKVTSFKKTLFKVGLNNDVSIRVENTRLQKDIILWT